MAKAKKHTVATLTKVVEKLQVSDKYLGIAIWALVAGQIVLAIGLLSK